MSHIVYFQWYSQGQLIQDQSQMTKAKTTTPKPRPVVIKAKDVTPALQQLHWLPIDYRITYKLCLIIHLVHTKRAPQYLSDSVQTVARSSSRPGLRSSQHSCLRQAEVQNQVRRLRLLACWNYCMEQSSTPCPSNQWHWSFQAPPQNWTIS